MGKNFTAIVLLTLLNFLLSSSWAHNLQMDPKNETKISCKSVELQETCGTMESAKACETTPYCIHCIWNTAFNPKEAVDEKCNACQEAIYHRDIITKEELISKMKSGCNIHKNESDKFICSELVQNLMARNSFWDVEKTDISSLDICSLLGLCFSQFDVRFRFLLAEKLGSVNDIENIISGENAATAKKAKVYRIFENGTRLNPSDRSTIPMFRTYSELAYYEHFRPGQFSKYSCQFVSVFIGISGWDLLAILLISLAVLFSPIVILCCLACRRLKNKDVE